MFKIVKKLEQRRMWRKCHLEYLRAMLAEDSRWLANNKVASELIARYEKATSEYWYRLPQEDISDFRKRIGLDPTAVNYSSVMPAMVDMSETWNNSVKQKLKERS